MSTNASQVLVQRLPECLAGPQARRLMRDLAPFLNQDRPRIVLDLSQVQQMDAAGIDVLLDSMTTVSKLDGDIKLAAPSDRAMVILELTQMDRLFEIFESAEEAAASFGGAATRLPGDMIVRESPSLLESTAGAQVERG